MEAYNLAKGEQVSSEESGTKPGASPHCHGGRGEEEPSSDEEVIGDVDQSGLSGMVCSVC